MNLTPSSSSGGMLNNPTLLQAKDVNVYYPYGTRVWRGTGRNGKTLSNDDPSIHEFGHLLNLKDHYTNAHGVDKGWDGNIMAERVMKGKVEQRNIITIVAPIIDSYNKSGKKQNEEYKYEIN